MNVFTGIMLVFALLGFADKAFSLKWGLSESFDKGLMTMGTMVVPIVGICSVGTEFIERHAEGIISATQGMPFDPSMIVGAILAPDLGGYFISKPMAATPEILIINGVVLGTLLGQAICFQLPVFLATIDRQDRSTILRGFLVGICMIPFGMLAAEAILRMNFVTFLGQFIPILIICALVAWGLYKIPDGMVKGFSVIGRIIQIFTYLLFGLAILGIFIPKIAMASDESVFTALTILVKSAIIISGCLVLTELIMKLFRPQLKKLANKMGVNEISVVCMLMNCATSLAILPLFPRMDEKGKLLNAAFSISGAYILGGSMAFVSAVSTGYVVMIFLVAKAVSGVLSMFVMHRIYKSNKKGGN